MRQNLQFLFAIFVLFGCSSIKNDNKIPVISLGSYGTNFINEVDGSIYTVPDVPKFNFYDWDKILSDLVDKMISDIKIKKNSTLFINSVENKNNIEIQYTNLVDILSDLIVKKGIFKLVSKDIVKNARNFLGFSYRDNFFDKNKIIGLARYIDSDFFICLFLSEKDSRKKIKIQLIKTKSAEIIWFGSTYFG